MARANLRPGDSVLYCGPVKGRYLPAEIPGQVERINGKRAWVRYPWGLQHMAVQNLRIIGIVMGVDLASGPPDTCTEVTILDGVVVSSKEIARSVAA